MSTRPVRPTAIVAALLAPLALPGLTGCTAAQVPSATPVAAGVRDVATPTGPFGVAAASAGLAVEITCVVTDAGTRASLVVAGVTLSEERRVGDTYYRRAEGASHVLGAAEWVAYDLTDPEESVLAHEQGLGLCRLAEQGGRHELAGGRTVELRTERTVLDVAPEVVAPPAAAVVRVGELRPRVADTVG